MTAHSLTKQTGKDIKNQFQRITEAEIETLAGTGSFGRGLQYYHAGHIEEPVLRGDTLYAYCEGSQEEPYALKATLARVDTPGTTDASAEQRALITGSRQITAYDCDCEAGGFCKHLVALLLTWIHTPERIEVRPEFAVRLEHYSREQLLALCVKLLQLQPDMEYLIEAIPPNLPLPAANTSESTTQEIAPEAIMVSPLANVLTVDAKAFARRVQKAFRHHSYEYEDYGIASQIASDLEPLLATGHEHAEAGQWANAQAVYETVALEALDGYDELEDEGELASVIDACCTGLANCLDAQAQLPESARLNETARGELIESIYKIWEYDLKMGGIDLATDAEDAIARNVTADEREDVETWLEEGMKPGKDFSSNFDHAQRVQFLIALRIHSGISDEEKRDLYAKHGLYEEMTSLLLQMGRVDDAIRVALQEMPESKRLAAFATKLIAAGGENITRAFAFIEQQLERADADGQSGDSNTYLLWLSQNYAQHAMPDKALRMQQRLFDAGPTRNRYIEVKQAAQLPGQTDGTWMRLRPALIATLETRGLWYDLTEIYIDEGDARVALDALKEFEAQGTAWRGGNLSSRVANVAEVEYPGEARVIYQLLAENLIEARGRDKYQVAASYLARAKDLAARENRTAEWNVYITNLRDRNNNLRALKEELRARKLI